MNKTFLNEELISNIENDFLDNLSIKKIAKKYNLSVFAVKVALKNRNIEVQKKRKNYIPSTIEEKSLRKIINEYLNSTCSLQYLSEKYQIHRSYLSTYLKINKLKKNKNLIGKVKTKLDKDQIKNAILEYDKGGISFRKLANKYNVGASTMKQYYQRKNEFLDS